MKAWDFFREHVRATASVLKVLWEKAKSKRASGTAISRKHGNGCNILLGGNMLQAAMSEISLQATIITLMEFCYVLEFLRKRPLEEFLFVKELSPNFVSNIM